jgi:hypothetical protein
MGPLKNNMMFKYFTGSRLITAPTGNAGPYGASSSGTGQSSAAAARPFTVPNLTVLAEVSAQVEVQVGAAGGSPGASSSGGSGGKARSSRHEGNKSWKSEWSAVFPWAEPQFDERGDVSCVSCAICSGVRGRPVLIKNKRDNLMKHAGSRRARARFQLGNRVVEVGEMYSTPDCQHVKNDRKFIARGLAERNARVIVREPPVITREMSKKRLQFVVIMDLLKRGRPMLDYANSFNLFDFLRFDLPKFHWSDDAGWEIADSLKAVVDGKLKDTVKESSFFSVSCDEVTTIANESWISIHIYVVQNFARVPILLCCKHILEDCNAENLARIITDSLIREAGLNRREIAEKMISFGSDGASVFQGNKGGVTKRLTENVAPFMVGHHCVAHRVQLAAGKLSSVPMVEKVEVLCNSLYSYFAKSPKRFLAYLKFAEELGTNGNKVLRNVKPRWLSLLDPMIRVLDEYKTLVATMDECDTLLAKKNLRLLQNFETLLCLASLIPLFDCVNECIKFAQARNVYICDFVASVNTCKAKLYKLFVDPTTAYTGRAFAEFQHLVDDKSTCVDFEWLPDIETHELFLNYNVMEAKHNCYRVLEDGREVPISKMEFNFVIMDVKAQAMAAAKMVIAELDHWFPDVDLINALGVVFPQYWQEANCHELFPLHMEVIAKFYSAQKTLVSETGQENDFTVGVLDRRALEDQVSIFKSAMINNSPLVMQSEEVRKSNPLSLLWIKLSASNYFSGYMSEWFKVAKLAVVTVIGSVEDERTFSILSWMKSKVRNRLNAHLDCTIRLYSQPWWTVKTFPYEAAIAHWEHEKNRRGTGR